MITSCLIGVDPDRAHDQVFALHGQLSAQLPQSIRPMTLTCMYAGAFRAVSPGRDADHRPGARPASFCVVRKGRMTARGRTKTQRLHWRGRRRSGGDVHGDVPLFHAVRPMTISLPSQPRKALTDGSSPFRMLVGQAPVW